MYKYGKWVQVVNHSCTMLPKPLNSGGEHFLKHWKNLCKRNNSKHLLENISRFFKWQTSTHLLLSEPTGLGPQYLDLTWLLISVQSDVEYIWMWISAHSPPPETSWLSSGSCHSSQAVRGVPAPPGCTAATDLQKYKIMTLNKVFFFLHIPDYTFIFVLEITLAV